MSENTHFSLFLADTLDGSGSGDGGSASSGSGMGQDDISFEEPRGYQPDIRSELPANTRNRKQKDRHDKKNKNQYDFPQDPSGATSTSCASSTVALVVAFVSSIVVTWHRSSLGC